METAFGSDPDTAVAGTQNGTDAAVAKCPPVHRIVPVYREHAAIVSVQAMGRPNPNESLLILGDHVHGIIGEAILFSQMLKSQFRGCKCLVFNPGRNGQEKTEP
jgi:hypothetical protein